MRYLFKVGITPHLASREISTYLTARKFKHQKTVITPEYLLIETKGQLPTAQLIQDLGGTIVIGTEVDSAMNVNLLPNKIAQLLQKTSAERKIVFSIEQVSVPQEIDGLSFQVKRELGRLGSNSRFVEQPKPIQILSQNVQVVLVTQISDRFYLYLVSDVTPVLDWQERDRGRPNVDARSGIMPPKVSRMLINLAVNTFQENLVVYDPFCGSGTILMEALKLGYMAIGSDVSKKAVKDSQQNLEWFTSKYPDKIRFTVFHADARTVKPSVLPSPAQVIVSEGYLGPTRFSNEEIPAIIASLQQLYEQALPNLYHCLSPKGRLLIALPKHHHKDSQKMLQYLIDTCENSGYTLAQSPLEYSQPNARVKRVILMLDKQ